MRCYICSYIGVSAVCDYCSFVGYLGAGWRSGRFILEDLLEQKKIFPIISCLSFVMMFGTWNKDIQVCKHSHRDVLKPSIILPLHQFYPELKKAEKNSILIFDGIYLFREELVNYWNYKIYLESSFEKTTQRAILRDSKLFGGKEKVIELYKKRYIPGHEMYLIMRNPIGISDIVINNNEFQNPTVIKISNNAYNKDILRIFDNFQKKEIY